MLKKIYLELVGIRKELQAIRNSLEREYECRCITELRKYEKATGNSAF